MPGNYRQKILFPEEVHFVAHGTFRVSLRTGRKDASALAALRARHERGDYRQAEALARDATDSFQLFKSLLARGSLDEAGELLPELRSVKDPAFAAEMLVQEARYHYLRGNWLASIRSCNFAEGTGVLPALSKMVLHQVRSNAFFELSDFQKSLSDFHRVESFESLFPHGQLPLYAHTNRVRLQTRMLGSEAGAVELGRLWKKWRTSLPSENLDPLLTLLRARIDVKREMRADFSAEAVASYWVAKALGDELYAGLAALDVFLAGYPKTLSSEWAAKLSGASAAHLRVRQLRDEVFRASETRFETAKSMANYLAEKPCGPGLTAEADRHVTTLIFVSEKIRVDLAKKESVALELTAQTREVLALMRGRTSMEKSDFFSAIWKLENFVSDRHDAAVRTALRRLHQQAGIRVPTMQQVLQIPSDVLILP